MNPRRDAEERLLWPTRWAAPRKAPLEFGPRDDRVERADRLRLYERMFDLPGPASSPNPDSPPQASIPRGVNPGRSEAEIAPSRPAASCNSTGSLHALPRKAQPIGSP